MLFFFFFSSRRRHTRCSRDWSSDVCSSDLTRCPRRARCSLRLDGLRGAGGAALMGELEDREGPAWHGAKVVILSGPCTSWWRPTSSCRRRATAGPRAGGGGGGREGGGVGKRGEIRGGRVLKKKKKTI